MGMLRNGIQLQWTGGRLWNCSGMLGKSLFVEEAHHAMVARAASNGHNWAGQGPMPHEVLLDMFLEPVQDIAIQYAQHLQVLLVQWTDHFLAYSTDYVLPCEAEIESTQTRFNHLTHLAREPLPESPAECIQWVWQIALASTSWSQLVNQDKPKFFPKGTLPQVNHSNGWHPGLYGKTAAKTLSKSVLLTLSKRLPYCRLYKSTGSRSASNSRSFTS